MAEILGTVASGFAVVSLAIQVAETIHKLKSFHSLMQSAPADILFAIEELETLSMVLEDVDRSMQEQLFLDPRVKGAVMRSWRLCKVAVDGLVSLMGGLEEGPGKGKLRGSLRVAMKKGEMDDFRKKIESAKTTMQLANQIYYQATQSQRWESLERDVLNLRRSHEQTHSIIEREVVQIRTLVMTSPKISGIYSQGTIEGVDVADNVKGREDTDFDVTPEKPNVIRRRWKPQQQSRGKKDGRKFFSGLLSIVLSADEHNMTTSVSFGLPRWIYARRFELRMMKSRQGWDQSFRSYRTVSYDAKVFDYCMHGNVVALQQLFASGQASPFEIDPDGRTPLHYAALYAHSRVCNFLLEQGADANLRTFWYGELSRVVDYARLGEGFFMDINDIPTRAVFRGWPAYSTPLHLLLNTGHLLIENGRQGLNTGYCQSGSDGPMVQDFEATVKALVTSGADLMLEDQYSRTAFHSYTGPTPFFGWLVQDSEWDLQTATEEYFLDMIRYLAVNFTANMPELVYRLVTERSFQTLAGFSTNGGCLLHALLFAWTLARRRDLPSYQCLESLFVTLIHRGADLHITTPEGFTPLCYLLRMFETQPTEKFYIERWLELLSQAGVDLVEYGRIENEMHDNHETRWTFRGNIEATDNPANECRFELVSLWIGETADDFYIEFEDLYVSAGLAVDFWKWVEAPSVEDRMKAMPGSWQGD
ncbi:hypothetical protein BKA61DRAFT_692914 [Leptodontidium sp. MPI-SDFR-AT-0119]|nr:hypothetical protein BKA61DRAFT_692914 [Leptodontidium sp. MPI-SDFR-AT-0119]